MIRTIVFLIVLTIVTFSVIFGLGTITYHITAEHPQLDHLETLLSIFFMGLFSCSMIGISILTPWIIYDKIVADCCSPEEDRYYSEF
jgi:hypothetical protein